MSTENNEYYSRHQRYQTAPAQQVVAKPTAQPAKPAAQPAKPAKPAQPVHQPGFLQRNRTAITVVVIAAIIAGAYYYVNQEDKPAATQPMTMYYF